MDQYYGLEMLERTISMIFLAILVHLVWGVAGSVEFSKSYNDLKIIKTLPDVSMATCAKECESRRRCKSAVYHRRAGFCTLASRSQHDIVQPPISSKGAVFMGGFHPDTQFVLNTCDGSTCQHRETCTTTMPGSRSCAITECRPLPAFYEAVFGNLYGVGNRLLVKGSLSDMRVTCGEDGFWFPDPSRVAYDCTDVFGDSGVYTVSQGQVYCDMQTAGGHWLVFQRRSDGSEDFLRNWVDYRTGFGQLQGEFWLGLEIVHQILGNGEYELRVDMEDFDGVSSFAKYSYFRTNSETDYYSLLVSGYSGDAGDSLSGHSGMNFSTFDQDNDICPCNCGSIFSGAWWYGACHASNLNGLYFHGGQNTTQYANHIHWYTFRGHWHSLKMTEMKLRRKWIV